MDYYYLISGLPNISLEKQPKGIDFPEVIDTIQRNLTEADRVQFDYLLLQNDNQNLLNEIYHVYHGQPKAAHLFPSVFNETEIAEFKKNRVGYPDYLGDFIRNNEDPFTQLSPIIIEQRLTALFDQAIENQHEFLISYLLFEREVNDFFAAFNHSHYGFLTTQPAVFNSLLLQLEVGKPIPTALLASYPFVERVSAIVENGNPDSIIDLYNKIRWDYLDVVAGFFGLEQVLAYAIKLMIVYSKGNIDMDLDEGQFDQLKEQLRNKAQVTQT